VTDARFPSHLGDTSVERSGREHLAVLGARPTAGVAAWPSTVRLRMPHLRRKFSSLQSNQARNEYTALSVAVYSLTSLITFRP
jgi:hypothetical protein